jgi:putative endonuclease
MAGLVPAIHVLHYPPMLGGYVYILASAPNGILYVGVTNDLVRRIYEHRNGLIAGFTKRYSVKRLVYFEHTKKFRQRSSANTTSSIGRENGK